MKSRSALPRPHTLHAKLRQSKGFALVVTLSLMILLTVIAMGLLSLSAISLRSGSQSRAQTEAQSNARLALAIALGELQKQLGPDQRISANSAILSASDVRNPHWTGVWNSWQAGAPNPLQDNPSDPSEHQTVAGARARLGMHPTYVENRRDHFRSWLLSLNPGEESNVATASFYFRKNDAPRAFFSSRWPIGDHARALIFFYHDPESMHIRIHTIRDFM